MQAAWEKLCMADSRFPNTPAILTAMGDCQIHLKNRKALLPGLSELQN
jgi:hypothetical protein